jgi:aminoglycoside 3'-phosphotransferase-2
MDAMETLAAPPSAVTSASAPSAWRGRLTGYSWERESIGESQAIVFRLRLIERPTLFAKAERSGIFCEILNEAARLRWMKAQGLPCPEVLGLEASAGCHWLLMSAVPGTDLASHRDLLPTEVIALVVAALRRLHAMATAGCPFDHRLSRRIALAKSRLSAGIVDSRNFDDEHLGKSPPALLEQMLGSRPEAADLVLAHGDACLPNFMADGETFTGYLDCARLGIADRYQDLALAGSSIGRNLGVDWIEPFYRAYGETAPDRRKLAFYRALDEFF